MPVPRRRILELPPSSATVTIPVSLLVRCFRPRNKVDNPCSPPMTTMAGSVATAVVVSMGGAQRVQDQWANPATGYGADD